MQYSFQRHKIFIAVLFCLLLNLQAFPKSTQFKQSNVKRSVVSQASRWLKSQQDTKTGLLRSFDKLGDRSAATYDQAVGIIAFVAVGDVDPARHCADGMLRIRDDKYRMWADIYDSGTGQVKVKPIALGPNAWMGIALLDLYQSTKEQKYLSAAVEVGEFILKKQVRESTAKGSILCGFDEEGKAFTWTSTENNADAIALLAFLSHVTGEKRYCEAAVGIADWLERQMWSGKFYYPGYKDNKTFAVNTCLLERLDSQTWIILAMHAAAKTKSCSEIRGLMRNGLVWIDKHLNTVIYEGKKLVGFGKKTFDSEPSIWAEGTIGYILAARRIGHGTTNLEAITNSLRSLQGDDGSVLHSVGIIHEDLTDQLLPSDILVADFETHPNRLSGEVGVYGDGETNWDVVEKTKNRLPYSWYYEPKIPGYTKSNVHTGDQSFRLVNAGPMCAFNNKGWAGLAIDLGPKANSNKVKPLNVSTYRKLEFWAKTDNKRGAAVKIILRDADTKSTMPQVIVSPVPSQLDNNWRKHSVDLSGIRSRVNLRKLVHIGLEFGMQVGNAPGTIIYVDDIVFTGSPSKTSASNVGEMPKVFPQNWPYGCVAATSWWIFLELDFNPYALFVWDLGGR